jgi:DNA-binding transcriptional MerR regulator
MNLSIDYLEDYFDDSSINNLMPLLDELLEGEYALRDVGIHPRTMHSWYTHSLLPYDEKGQHKHSFTLFDVFWIWIIEDLRKYGYPYKMIRKAKDYMMAPFNMRELLKQATFEDLYNQMNEIYHIGPPFKTLTQEQKEFYQKTIYQEGHSQLNKTFPAISIIIMEFIYTRKDWLMMFDQEGNVNIGLRSEYGYGQAEELYNNTYIVLPLIRYFSRLLSNARYFLALDRINFIGDKEMEVLDLIRQGDLKTVSFHYKKGSEPTLVEITKEKRIDQEARICDIMTKGHYEKIEFNTQSGHITHGTKTTKINLKKK